MGQIQECVLRHKIGKNKVCLCSKAYNPKGMYFVTEIRQGNVPLGGKDVQGKGKWFRCRFGQEKVSDLQQEKGKIFRRCGMDIQGMFRTLELTFKCPHIFQNPFVVETLVKKDWETSIPRIETLQEWKPSKIETSKLRNFGFQF